MFYFQGTASESSTMALLAAKMKAIRQQTELNPDKDQYEIMSKLVAYTSEYVIIFILIIIDSNHFHLVWG